MKKLLILAYDFPPYVSVGGLRPYSWYKNLKEFGVEPIVVTRQWDTKHKNALDYISASPSQETLIEQSDLGTIVRTPYKANLSNKLLLKYGEKRFILIRKLISGFFEFGQYFLMVGPKKQVYFGARDFLTTNKVDAIIATGDPFILFKYASKLSKEFDIPWFADYRDDWIDNHVHRGHNKFINNCMKMYFRFFEKKYIGNVKGISSVSDYLVQQISARNSLTNCEVIENGADLELYVPSPSPFQNGDFNILYSGRLYDLPYLDDFQSGFEQFLESRNFDQRIKATFIGTEVSCNMATEQLQKLKDKYPAHIALERSVSSTEIARFQMNAHILLNLIAGDPEKGLIGAKSYNYAVTRNAILTIPQIKNNKSVFFPNRDIQYIALSSEDVYKFLDLHFDLFDRGVQWSSSLTNEEQYQLSRKYNTEKLLRFIFK